MKDKEFRIGQRIVFNRAHDKLHADINQRAERWQEALIFAWVCAWALCGIYFIITLLTAAPGGVQIFMAVVLGFWGYFMVTGVKIFLWRLRGIEKIEVSMGTLTIRNAIGTWGKTQRFESDKIEKLGIINLSERNFFRYMDMAFWSQGGETIGFKYKGKNLVLGKQLNEKDAARLLSLLDAALKDFKARR